MKESNKLTLADLVKEFRISTGIIFLIVCCTNLIIWSTFVQFDITHFILPKGVFSGEKLNYKDFLYTYKIIPQIPIVIFVGALLGRKYGIISILLYIILGLFVIPVFAIGGGARYIFEYGFGFILAYIPAVFFADSILKSGFSNKNMLKASFVGVLTIHLIGILYMLFIASLKHEGLNFITGWIAAQSGLKIAYDFVLSFALVFVAKYARILFWIYG